MKRPPRANPAAFRRRERRAAAAATGIALGVLCCTLAPTAAEAASPKKGKSSPGVGLYKKAEASFARKDYQATLDLLAKAEAAGGAPQADVRNLRGAVHLRRREFDKAREEFSAAASADKSLLAARYNLAEVDFEQGRYVESRRRLSGLVGRAKGRSEKDFFQYKALLADLLDGKEETAVRYLSEHRGDPGKPSAEFCYLSAALAYRHGKPEEARRWTARVPKRAPQPVKRVFAASLEKFGPRLASSSSERGPANFSADAGGNAGKPAQTTAAARDRDSRGELDNGRPMSESASAATGGGAAAATSSDSARGQSTADSLAGDGSAPPAAVAMVQLVSESGKDNATRTTNSAATAARAASSTGNAAATPKFRYGEISATNSDFLLAAAAPTPKPTPSAGGSGSSSSPKAGAGSSPSSTAASPSASAAATAKPTAPPVPTPEPPTEAFNQKYEAAFVAFSKRDYAGSLQALKEADTIQPGQADPANLRGLIYARQRLFEQAEVEFKRAVQLDPTFWAAKFNLADLPFTYRNYGLARSRFETLLSEIDPAALPRETELTQFKIFLTLLLEGKEASARAFMTRFKFEGSTPARLYAQAALDFHAGNFQQAVSWMESAKKQFPPQLEALFAESFFRIGWLTNTPGLAQADPATGGSPAASPSPVPTPGLSLAQAPTLPSPPILETGDGTTATTTSADTGAAALTLAPSSPSPAVPSESPQTEVAAATPAPTPELAATPTLPEEALSPSPGPARVAVATPTPLPSPSPASPSASPQIASASSPAPLPTVGPTAARGTPAAQPSSAPPWLDRLIRVILPAFLFLYVLYTPVFIAAVLFKRRMRARRKSRQIKVPLTYPSGKLARHSKGESAS